MSISNCSAEVALDVLEDLAYFKYFEGFSNDVERYVIASHTIEI